MTSATVFSLSNDPPSALAAGPLADSSGLDEAALVDGDLHIPCRVRRLSASGATLQIDDPLDRGAAFCLDLGSGHCVSGSIGWVSDDEAGFLFDAPLDVIATMARNLARLPAERRRVPRVELSHSIGIRHGGEFGYARTLNVSQAGVGIETSLWLAEDDQVEVAFDGLSPVSGTVRWASDGRAGIAFETELSWQTLMPWLRESQRAAARPQLRGRTADEGSRFGLSNNKQAIRLNAPARVREGARWWNIELEQITAHLVEFRCGTPLAKGTQLWLWLPGFPGWPATVIEAEGLHYLAEFRLPLRQHDIDLLLPMRLQARVV